MVGGLRYEGEQELLQTIACEGPSPPVAPEERVWCHPVATQFWDGVRGDSVQKKNHTHCVAIMLFLSWII